MIQQKGSQLPWLLFCYPVLLKSIDVPEDVLQADAEIIVKGNRDSLRQG